MQPNVYRVSAVLACGLLVSLLVPLSCTPMADSDERQLGPGEIDPAFIALAGAEPPSVSTPSFLAKFRGKPADVKAVVATLEGAPSHVSWFETVGFARSDAAKRYASLTAGKLAVGRHDPVLLPAEPTWRENPLGDRNWQSLYHCLRWLLPPIWVGEDAGDVTALRFAERYVLDYLRKNPLNGWRYPWGDQRTAERAKVMVTLYESLRRRRLLSEDSATLLVGSLWEYGNLLADRRFYSYDSNHGLFQNEALLDIALAVPQFEASGSWRNLALARMDDQLVRNVSANGVHLEGAVGYHAFPLSHFEGYVRYATDHRMPISRTMASRLLGMVYFQLLICRGDGTMPMIGDTEREPAPFDRMTSLLASLRRAGAVGDAALALRARQCEKMLVYVQSGGTKGTPPKARSAAFAKEGYFVFRTRPAGAGEPAGMLLLTADRSSDVLHNHEDALSLCYSAGGADFLIDSGKFTYARDERRGFFRSTPAHSTIVVNDASHGEVRPRVIDSRLTEAYDYVEVEHNGYAGVRCNRVVIHTAAGWAVVIDEVTSQAPMSCAVLWQFHPDAKLTHGDTGTVAELAGKRLHVLPLAGGTRREVIRGRKEPMAGWVSFEYGEMVPRTVLRYGGGGSKAAFVTVLVPAAPGEKPPTARLLAAEFGRHYSVRIEQGRRTASIEIDRRAVPRRLIVDVSP